MSSDTGSVMMLVSASPHYTAIFSVSARQLGTRPLCLFSATPAVAGYFK
jgi:hypothetical protein